MSNPLIDTLDKAIEVNEKLSSENNRLTMALQDIRECVESDHVIGERALKVLSLVREALEGEEEPVVKVNHEGHLYVFGEETIEVEYLGNVNPFKRVGKELDK